MTAPVIDDSGILGTLTTILVAIGAAIAGALGMAWRTGVLIAKLNAKDEAIQTEVTNLVKDVLKLEGKVDAQVTKAEERHEENQDRLVALEKAVLLLPTKEDYRRFQDDVRGDIDGLKIAFRGMLLEAPKVWRETEAQEEQVRRSHRRLSGDDGGK